MSSDLSEEDLLNSLEDQMKKFVMVFVAAMAFSGVATAATAKMKSDDSRSLNPSATALEHRKTEDAGACTLNNPQRKLTSNRSERIVPAQYAQNNEPAPVKATNGRVRN